MAEYKKETAVALAEELAERARNIVEHIKATPPSSEELIDHHAQLLGRVISLLKGEA